MTSGSGEREQANEDRQNVETVLEKSSKFPEKRSPRLECGNFL